MTDDRPTLLVIHPFGGTGGSEEVLVNLVIGLREEFEVIALVMARGPLGERLRELGVDLFVHPLPGKRSLPLIPAAARALGRRLLGRGVTAIHANGTKAAMLGAPLARRLGAPLVWMKHGHDFDWLAPRLVGPRCEHIVCVSSAVAATFPARLQDRTSVVYPGVRLPPTPPVLSPDPVIVSAGTLIPSKGHDTLIRAVAVLRDRGLPGRLEIAGADHPNAPGDRARLRALSAKLGVEDRVELLGWVDDVGSVYGEARVVALASRSPRRRTPAEGAPLVLLEAMGMARPVVAPAESGIEEIVGGAGALVTDATPGGYADALGPYLQDRDLALAVGRSGRDRIASRFTIDRMVSELSSVYRDLGARAESSPAAR